jgi:hypothetical protein
LSDITLLDASGSTYWRKKDSEKAVLMFLYCFHLPIL